MTKLPDLKTIRQRLATAASPSEVSRWKNYLEIKLRQIRGGENKQSNKQKQ